VSPESAKQKLYRILVIAAIVAASRLLIMVLQALSRLVIYSAWGPLRFVYRRHKNRVMTLHSLALNLVKYVVYFAALGFVLGEMGVNYTTYLASLSVIGLAVGFGSQGLVQDVVTGFFIIFERQFDVGDMVEISGQTGIVEELGLRMTRLRNYVGQVVVIPNRNIAMVGNYLRGALQAQVDVAVKRAEDAERAVGVLACLAREVSRQFPGVFLGAPKVEGQVALETGEHFVRVCARLWPQQSWVIDGQFIPRAAELLAREGIETVGGRAVACYHVQR